MNLAKTASIKSVTTDTKILDAKKVETAELLVDGVSISEVIPKWKPREHIYRCVLEEDDDYIIYDDEGNFLDCKLEKLENGANLFQYGKGLEEFSFSLPSLTTGSGMFANCNLGEKAVESILRTIPEYSEGTHLLTMKMNSDAFEMFNEITGNIATTPGTILYKGWDIASNATFVLPNGYRKVEYLKSTGTQYIDTGFELSDECDVTLDMQMEQADIASCAIFGAQEAGNWQGYAVSLYQQQAQNYGWFFYKNTSSVILVKDIPTDNRYERLKMDITNGLLSINGEAIMQGNSGSFSTGRTCWLFHRNSYTTPSAFVGKIYSFTISRSGSLQRYFIPCIDNLGNPCMYDTITKETFRNEGSDMFLASESATTYSLRRPVPAYAKMTKHGIQKLYHTPEGYEGSEEDYAQENGFKLLTENERPEEGSWRPEWVETDNELILNWIEVEEEMTDV